MSRILRIGNLASSISAIRLAEICGEYGTVSNTRLAESPFSGQSRGFGFVEMRTEEEAAACVSGLNEKECEGRKLTAQAAPSDLFKKQKRRA